MSAKQNKKKSSNELWTDDKSNVNHLKKFECLIHVHISTAKRNKFDFVSFQRIFVNYHSNAQMKIFDSMTKKIQWHTAVKFLKNFSNDKLLKNDKNNQKNENSSTEIFDNENENEKNKNVETQIFQKQSIFDVANGSKLMKNNSFDLNRKNRENHIISINQKTKKSKNSAIFIQSTRRNTRNFQFYDRYRYDNEFEQKVQIFKFSSNQKFEFTTYDEIINCSNHRL